LRVSSVRQHCAQGDSDSTGCRIIIDGAVNDERSVKTVNAYTFCLDKSG
jgi:Mycobacterium membrane protein